jgi:hypothetical protein
MDMKAIAYHEIGHALACWITGGRIDSATIRGPMIDVEDGGRTPYYCGHAGNAAMVAALRAPMLTKELAWQYLSGIAGERVAGFEAKHSGDWDLKRLEKDALRPDVDSTTFTMRLWAITNPGAPVGKFRDDFLPELIELFKKDQFRRCLDAGAAALMKSGTLTGREIAEIFEKAHGDPLPPGVKPAHEHQGPEKPLTVQDHLEKVAGALDTLDKAADGLRWCSGAENPQIEKLIIKLFELKLFIQDMMEKV